MKCGICRKNIQETFLKKIVGTFIKDDKGRRHSVCFECQKKFKDKKSILQQLQ